MAHDIDTIFHVLSSAKSQWQKPVVTEIADKRHDPFQVLISTLLSLRTKDEVTREASQRLFKLADSLDRMKLLKRKEIEKAIYPVGFYRSKAKTILDICKTLIKKHRGKVPDNMDDLLSLKGVGRKTANLVLTMGYNMDGICVDTHVHRISNRLGYVSTKTPIETEFALMEKLPKKYWIEYNNLLVAFGQNICKPVSPLCSKCQIHDHCMRVGVKIHR
ncbi:MAG: endonuclease III [Candidatus Latescibacteria bacterium]|jgi:endonuclease III|nr:endonuclease III [Candidatus Latescibacterota bacterium]